MTLTPPVITPEQIAKIDDAHNWQTTAGRAEAFRAILALNNAAWPEMLAGQEAAIYVGANSLRQVANGNSMTIDASPEACKWADTPLYTTPVPAQAPAVAVPDGWASMKTAPMDGTAVLVLVDASDIPRAVRWRDANDEHADSGAGWYMTWDNTFIFPHDGPMFWMHCPADPRAAAQAGEGGGNAQG